MKHTNRLIHERSPYLLQHSHNPVDWYPWGAEAFAKAKSENKMIFLSVGYSTCHWCHVMERESFENEEIARVMNENFVGVKVDREERPDVDDTYMKFVQMQTHHGGWPMSVWLTPDRLPVLGRTYFPPSQFKEILLRMAKAWSETRQAVEGHAEENLKGLRQAVEGATSDGPLRRELVDRTVTEFEQAYDSAHGGFAERAPKFPRSHAISLILKVAVRKTERDLLAKCEHTLRSMAAGGMYDQLFGGFHRYSVDDQWLIPHFEKMLYDNALLARTYTEAFQITGNPEYRRITMETLDYVLREMTGPDGGFYSAQDADSEGEEGKFCVWTQQEILDALGPEEGRAFCDYYGVTKEGNFEHGKNVLHVSGDGRPFSPALAKARTKLSEIRRKRVSPHTDDKVLVCWNGLMIGSMAFAGQVFGDSRYSEAAKRAADLVLSQIEIKGRLMRGERRGQVMGAGYLEDYASFINALMDLYETEFDVRYLSHAVRLAGRMVELFEDKKTGGFFDTGEDHEQQIVRGKEAYDGAVPSGNSMAVLALIRLSRFTGRNEFKDRAERTFKAFLEAIGRYPQAYPAMVAALDWYLGPAVEVVIVSPRGDRVGEGMLSAARRTYISNRTLVFAEPGQATNDIGLLEGRAAKGGRATGFVCRDNTCSLPTTTLEEFEKLLK